MGFWNKGLSRGFSDEDLMAQVCAGRDDALAVLFERYHRLVLSIALRIVRDPGEAEDVMQSVFLEVFRAAGQFDASKGTTKVWILQYAYHRSLNRRQYLSLRGFYERTEDTAAPTTGPGTLESARMVRQALDRLSEGQRTTLEMAFFEGLTMQEIAAKTGESFSNVRHHYYRGLEKLRGILCEPSARASRGTSGQEIAHVGS